MICKL